MSLRLVRFVERTSAELVEAALRESDEEARWELVVELQRRGTRAELALAEQLMNGSAAEQELSCDIVGQLGCTRRELGAYPFGPETAALVQKGLRSPFERVQQAAASAAGHLKWETLLPDVLALVASPNEDVRYAVACALGGRNDDASIAALIKLSEDEDGDVRNWATFGLGTLCDRCDPEVCDALARRLEDAHPEARGEAWAGLAAKGDRRAFEAVRASLESDTLLLLAVEAAEAYADPLFLPVLKSWRGRCTGSDDRYLAGLLDNAIAACTR